MIRKAAMEDLTEILYLIEKVKKLMSEGGNPQWNSAYPGEREYKEDILEGELYLEELDGAISGFMAVNNLFPKEYEDVEWTTVLPANGIHRLAVNPSCHGRGVASRLFTYAEELSSAQGMKSMRLDTFSLNYAAQKLFKNNGYHFVEEIFMKGRNIPYFCFEKSLV